jgi:type II secretory ATPase GspE/PulE/Tfp pilus assembly ATPase PilB-like protein
MLGFIYVNVVCLAVAAALILCCAKLAVWINDDLPLLQHQQPIFWRYLLLAALALIILLWIIVPNFWLALLCNFVVFGGIFGWYWKVRVDELGSSGNLLSAISGGFGKYSENREAKRSATQLVLSYSLGGGKAAALPQVDDPTYPGVVLMDQLVLQTLEFRAQRVELTPSEQNYELVFTVDGVTYPQPPVQRDAAEPMILAVKQLTRMQLEERRRPQKAEFTVRDPMGNASSWMAHCSGTTAGEKLVLQINEIQNWKLPLDHLGFSAEQLDAVKKIVDMNNGLVIVTSPPHMGRTTTLYSLLASHDAYTTSIQTMEVMPKADFESVTINRFDPQAVNASHSKTLSSIMLKDPHVLLVAQCPDVASGDLVARFASEDHRVYLGLRQNDALGALDLWRKLAAKDESAAKPLRAIIATRTLRLLCPTCKIAYQPDAAMLAKVNMPVGRQGQFFRANTQPGRDEKGNLVRCPDCGSLGYRGVTGIFEVLVVNDAICAAIASGKSHEEIRTLARKNNMMLLVEHGIRKFALGITSIQEVLRVCATEKNPPGKSPRTSAPVR